MIPDYKQSCQKISLHWYHQTFRNFPTKCPFCANDFLFDISLNFVECLKCKYCINGYSYRSYTKGIDCITYHQITASCV